MSSQTDPISILKALAHPARLAILEALRYGEACVCHLEALFGWRQAYLSQQLMVLRNAGLLADRREGWNVYYRVIIPDVFVVIDALHQITDRKSTALPPILPSCSCPRCRQEGARETSQSNHLKEPTIHHGQYPPTCH